MIVGMINEFRVKCITLAMLVLYGCIVFYAFFLQVVQSPFLSSLGKKQCQLIVTNQPPRATIFDRRGKPLAFNKSVLSAFITPNNIHDKKALVAFLNKQFPQAAEKLAKLKTRSCFLYVKRHLTPEEVILIEQAELEDMHLVQEQRRFYVIPSLGHTIGITDIDNHGLSGLELMFDKRLSGSPTTYRVEKDARSSHYHFKEEKTRAGADGVPVQLTIDSDLQFIAYDALKKAALEQGAHDAMALIMDPTTGDLLALACYPDFDPNEAAPAESFKTKNRIFTETYEFGSVMKVFPALAALDEGVVRPDEIIDCENRKITYVSGVRVTTWKAFGQISYTDVIRQSNNIGTSKVALRLKTKLYDHILRCGFTRKTAIKFLGEQPGYMTPPDKWTKPTIPSLSYGYEVSATLMQLACGYALIANDGVVVPPRLIIDETQPKPTPQRVYRPEPVLKLKGIIELAPVGTGVLGCISGYTIFGKTGGAYLLSNGRYDYGRSIFTFAGIVEKGAYKRLILVTIKEPRQTGTHMYASFVAAPVFREIAQQMLVHERVVR